jgi:hypothetical protein
VKGCPSKKLFIIHVSGEQNINPTKTTKVETFENKVQI